MNRNRAFFVLKIPARVILTQEKYIEYFKPHEKVIYREDEEKEEKEKKKLEDSVFNFLEKNRIKMFEEKEKEKTMTI